MSLYRDHVLPRVINRVCATKLSDRLRERACAPLTGRVVEIGFGSGLNVPHYPAAVTRVDAVDPSEVAWHLASDRVAAAAVPVTWTGRDAQYLPYDDSTFEAALSTWTMCTVPDPRRALAEIRRVLEPGGRLCFVEHGLAPDANVQRWQHRLDPLQQRLAGGCHLTRQIAPLLLDSGFDLVEVDAFYEPGAPRVVGAATLGVAESR